MAQYTTVTWSPGDGAVGEKFAQMAQNEEWLKENIILGNVNYFPNALGEIPDGRQNGAERAVKLEGVGFRYNSQTPTTEYRFTVPFPPVFTKPPLVVASNWDTTDATFIRQVSQKGTESADFKVKQHDGLSRIMNGYIFLILMGV